MRSRPLAGASAGRLTVSGSPPTPSPAAQNAGGGDQGGKGEGAEALVSRTVRFAGAGIISALSGAGGRCRSLVVVRDGMKRRVLRWGGIVHLSGNHGFELVWHIGGESVACGFFRCRCGATGRTFDADRDARAARSWRILEIGLTLVQGRKT